MKANVVLLIIIIIGNNTKTKQKPTCFGKGIIKVQIFTLLCKIMLCVKIVALQYLILIMVAWYYHIFDLEIFYIFIYLILFSSSWSTKWLKLKP